MKFTRRLAVPLIPIGIVLALAAGGVARARAVVPSAPQSTEANITRLTTGILEQSQLAHRPFDRDLASTLVDRYLDSLDGTRSLFLQTDIDELATDRTTLAQEMRESGDTRTAQAIFRRYLDRLAQQTAYVNDVLRTTKLDFTGHETYSFDREHAERPRDIAAARAIWLQQLRSEYLTEKLRDSAKTADLLVSMLTLRHAQTLKTMKSLRSDEVLDIYLDTLAHVYDPHSDYLGHEQMDSFSIAMNLSLAGIGATLESTDGFCTIRALVPGGPADGSGLLKPGDRIVTVAQPDGKPVDLVGMPLSRAVQLIRGPKGSTLELTILPAGAADGSPGKGVALVRDDVKLEDQAARARIVDMPNGKGSSLRLGVVELPSFYAGTSAADGAEGRSATADVARLLAKLNAEHVQGVVLDLRRNGGGSLKEAIGLTGLFIRKGPVVQTRDQAGKIDVDSDTDPSVAYDGPLVVLTSRYSASASEILAGALQDYGRALVVGDPSTFGKGTVQSVLPLASIMDHEHLAHAFDPGALKITVSKFYRPSGASTQLRGVASDIVVPSLTDLPDVSESSLKGPLPWDTVPSTPHEACGRVESRVVAALRTRSARRVAAGKELAYVEAESARLRKNLATRSVSLNEAERRADLVQARTRRDDLDREERSLNARRPPAYEITLANASTPGLPAATDVAKKANRRATVADDADQIATSRLADDAVLDETEKVLADYVGLAPLRGSSPSATTR